MKDSNLLIIGDYPYYRDDPVLWAKKVAAIKELGINTITCYIPWRHHLQQDGTFQFSYNPLMPNQDLYLFLNIVHSYGLKVIIRPGPFIHAEVQLGGLPNFVSPSHNKCIKPIINWQKDQLKSSEGKLLPFPFDKYFLDECGRWYEGVMSSLFPKFSAPHGPIIGIQIGNEGIFSDINWKEEEADFSSAHENQENKSLDALCYQKYIEYFSKIIHRHSNSMAIYFSVATPVLQNPLVGWLNKVKPEHWGATHYCYSHWQGRALNNTRATKSIMLAAKRFSSINIEENAGFDWDNEDLKDPHNYIYQAALHLASGARGISLYPIVGTSGWGETIEVDKEYLNANPTQRKRYSVPYGALSPIGVDGKANANAAHIKRFLSFIDAHFKEDAYRPVKEMAVIWSETSMISASKRIFELELRKCLHKLFQAGIDFDIYPDSEAKNCNLTNYRQVVLLNGCHYLKNTLKLTENVIDFKNISPSKLQGGKHLVFIKKTKSGSKSCCFIFNKMKKIIRLKGTIDNVTTELLLAPNSMAIFIIDNVNKIIMDTFFSAPLTENKPYTGMIFYNQHSYSLNQSASRTYLNAKKYSDAGGIYDF